MPGTNGGKFPVRNDSVLMLLVVWIGILMAWALYSLIFDILFSIPID